MRIPPSWRLRTSTWSRTPSSSGALETLQYLVFQTDSTQNFRRLYTPEWPRKSSRRPSHGSTSHSGRLCQSTSAGCCSGVCAAAAPWAAPCGRWSASVRGLVTSWRSSWTGKTVIYTANWDSAGNLHDKDVIALS